jgi:Foot protein 3
LGRKGWNSGGRLVFNEDMREREMTMVSRILLGAILALVTIGSSVESRAADAYGPGYRAKARYNSSHAPRRYRRSYVYRGSTGWHLFGYQLEPFTFNGGAYNFPGNYNNHTFWERVQTQGNYPVQY